MRRKRAFKTKQKAFFIIFKELSVVKNLLRPESTPLKAIHHLPLISHHCFKLFNHWFFLLIKNPVRNKINSQWVPYDTQFFINKQPQVNCHKAIAWYFEFSSGLIGLNGLNFEGMSSKKIMQITFKKRSLY